MKNAFNETDAKRPQRPLATNTNSTVIYVKKFQKSSHDIRSIRHIRIYRLTFCRSCLTLDDVKTAMLCKIIKFSSRHPETVTI